MNPFAQAADAVGTFLNLPDWGVSETLNGGAGTQNTGRVGFGGANPSSGSANLINTAHLATNPTVSGAWGTGVGGGAATTAQSDPYAAYGGYANYQAVQQQNAQRDAQKSQLNTQLGQLDNQQNIGLGNLQNSFNRSANGLDDQNAVNQRNYDTQTAQNQRSYLNTRNGVMQNTRATANSLQRLLGMNGAGNSSAAYDQAPYAAALQGSTQLSGAQQTYGNNGTALDTNWQDTQRQYQHSKDDLNQQLYAQQNGLKSSIAQTRADILSKLQAADGSTAYQGQINDLLGKITGMSNQYANPVLRAADVHYNAPDLAGYTLGKQAAIDQSGGQGGAASDINPLFSSLLGTAAKRDEFGNPIQA